MTDEKKNICCEHLNWEFVQDASHARGCEFTYGKCSNCGSDLIHMFHTMANHEHYEKVTADVIAKIQSLEGKDLKQFMKQWYDEIN